MLFFCAVFCAFPGAFFCECVRQFVLFFCAFLVFFTASVFTSLCFFLVLFLVLFFVLVFPSLCLFFVLFWCFFLCSCFLVCAFFLCSSVLIPTPREGKTVKFSSTVFLVSLLVSASFCAFSVLVSLLSLCLQRTGLQSLRQNLNARREGGPGKQAPFSGRKALTRTIRAAPASFSALPQRQHEARTDRQFCRVALRAAAACFSKQGLEAVLAMPHHTSQVTCCVCCRLSD